jgi:hypothetical protein
LVDVVVGATVVESVASVAGIAKVYHPVAPTACVTIEDVYDVHDFVEVESTPDVSDAGKLHDVAVNVAW